MPEIEFNSQEVRLVDLASRGLFRTINSRQYIKSALAMAKIRPEVIDKAVEAAIAAASRVSTEEAKKRWNIVIMLCSLKSTTPQPSQKITDYALEQAAMVAAKINNWEFFIAIANLTAPARKPSQEVIDKILANAGLTATKTSNWDFVFALLNKTILTRQPSHIAVDRVFELATVTALQTKNWESVIALARLAPPAPHPTKRAINSSLELALLRMIRYERHGDIESSSKICEAIKAIINIHPPANVPDKELVDKALYILQRRTNKHFILSAQYGEWEQLLNYFIQDQWGKPSQNAMNCALTYALTTVGGNPPKDVFKALCSFMPPDKRTAGSLLLVAARIGRIDVVQLLCNLDEQNKPSLSFIKNAFQIAQHAENHEITSYLSYELMHQHHLERDPLALTKTILTDYCDHHTTMSHLFNTHLKQVKTILARVKQADKETAEDVRNKTASEAVNQLKAMNGVDKGLKVCIDYIDEHCRKNETTSIKAEL
ncbi:hypothetical protein [Legionella parisiensis]|uniref:Uncharacterized protein n=1 Tax=Legionella parisiensis TaxID=45071 RepID=A0A1E5JNH5_9GAMM|nr:hypothetical protein [Legionella parisiensis]KTD44221.1 hypothetical protein Lpar_0307 [Legionella parisiensis]OEH46084.1 hypothetical protein lpari_02967 [Legionella parisiensis]STX71845.1 Uncharacterised protein [Legionella parisiensis]